MAEMEEKAGVDLDWQIYYNSDWSEQKSLLLLLVNCRMHLLEVSV